MAAAVTMATAAVSLVPGTTATAAESATVRVHANTFDPVEVAVDPDGAVTWVVQEDGHNIVADDHRFAFRGERGGPLPAGSVVSHDVGPTPGYIGYHCEIHGGPGLAGMSGRIRVGDPPRPVAPRSRVIRVPGDAPTLEAAVDVAGPGERIELQPGEHGLSRRVVVTTDGLTIAGGGASPADVVLVPRPGVDGLPGTAMHVTASRVRIENLTVRGFRTAGVHLDLADAVAITDVTVDGASIGLDGIRAERVAGATLRRTVTTGARRAGILVTDCARCGTLVDGVRSEGNLVGLLVEAARGIVVRRSTIAANGAGIIATGTTSDDTTSGYRTSVLTLVGNRVLRNLERGAVARARPSDRRWAVGAGIWLQGASDSQVLRNTVAGNGYGIVVAAGLAHRTQLRDNRSSRNLDADLAWDGLGADVCFADDSGRVPTSDPPAITELYPCDRPTVGLPYPVVAARLAGRAGWPTGDDV